MAEIIKLKTRPNRWLLTTRLKNIAPHHLVKAKNYISLEEINEYITKNKIESKNKIDDFKSYSIVSSKNAFKKAFAKTSSEIASHIIFLYLVWKNNIDKEGHSLFQISKWLSSNILNTKVKITKHSQQEHYLKRQLTKMFNISISISYNEYKKLKDCAPKLTSEFDRNAELLLCHNEETCYLDVYCEEKHYKMDLTGCEMRHILSSALQNYKNMSQ